MAILFIILFFVGFAIIPIFPFVSVMWTIFSFIGYMSKISSYKDKEQGTKEIIYTDCSISTIIKTVFSYYKVSILIVLCIFISINAFSKLGTVLGIITVVLSLLLIIHIYKLDKNFQFIGDMASTFIKKNTTIDSKFICESKTFNSAEKIYKQTGGGKAASNKFIKYLNKFKGLEIN